LGKEQLLLEAKALPPLNASVVRLSCHLIARQVGVDAKKYLLGLYPRLVVVLLTSSASAEIGLLFICQVAAHSAAWQYPWHLP
jgi:hypothetical protein